MIDVLRRLRVALVPLAIVAALLALPLAALYAAGRSPAAQPPADAVAAGPSPAEVLADMADRSPVEKLDSGLTAIAKDGDAADVVMTYVQSDRAVDFDALTSRHHAWTMPAGEHVAFVEVPVGKLGALAALPGVARVSDASQDATGAIFVPKPMDMDGLTVPYEAISPEQAVQLRAQAEAAPPTIRPENDSSAGAKPAPSAKGGPEPKGWHDIWRNHSAKEAWDLGYTGKGVKVAVLDTSVDFAHPDLQGTYAVYEKGPYTGWPEIFDPYGVNLWSQDVRIPVTQGRPRAQQGAGGLVLMSNVVTPTAAMVNGTSVLTGCVQSRAIVRPANQNLNVFLPPNCSFVMPPSKSGRILHGYHPDANIRPLGGEPNAVPFVVSRYMDMIVVDANTSGVYDTVYVDLDFDRDFTDEMPQTKANPVAWRDINGNGIADFSAGTVYWISDGQSTPPGSYLFGLADEKPAAGMYVAIQADTGGHGTLCASNVASRGVLGVPDAVSLQFQDLPGNHKPMPLNPGMGKEAKIISVGNIYSGGDPSFDAGWRFGVLGADPADPSDDPQITSNSYGFSGNDDDGWDLYSHAIDYYVRTFNPTSTGLYSNGNGGPGYGTIPVPKPATGMGIAASTQMGSTGWDSAYDTKQITFGDITPWSDRGPIALLGAGASLAADGAYASGSSPLNAVVTNANQPEFKRDGEFANGTWGGTSRSSPVAAGLMSLIYQAFDDKHGRWPTWQEARSIAMAGSRFNGYDAFVTGAGVLDAADAARIAGGLYGVASMPSEWTTGGYRGKTYPAFAKMQTRGSQAKQTFTLSNADDKPVEVKVSGQWLRRVGHTDIPWTSKTVTEEVGSPTSFNAPQYLVPIDKDAVPAGTDLMVVRMAYPLEDMDFEAPDVGPWRPGTPKESYLISDNIWRLTVYQHTDRNDNQKLWNDANGNGVVDLKLSDFYTQTLDSTPPGNPAKISNMLDYGASEIEQGEYMRFAYLNNDANNHLVTVHHPLERWGNGIYIGLSHWEAWFNAGGTWDQRGRSTKMPVTDLTLRVDYYDYVDWPWLSTGDSTVTIPAAAGGTPGTFTVDATMSVPADAAYGSYVGAIFADYARDTAGGDVPVFAELAPEEPRGGYELPGRRLTIPVNVNVAASYGWNGPVTFGGAEGDDRDAPYNNGAVAGAQSWGWRPESGDWRYFLLDAAKPPKNTLSYLISRTRWDDPSEKMTDIDTRLYGPSMDRYTDPTHPANGEPEADGQTRNRADTAWYGPHTLALLAQSPSSNIQGDGRWAFNTSSGGNEDWVSAPAGEGLHELMLDNVLFSGSSIEIPFETTVGSIRITPGEVVLEGPACTEVALMSDLPIDDLAVMAYGMHPPVVETDQPAKQDDQNVAAAASYRYTYTLESEAARLSFTVDGNDDGVDLDLFVLYDNNADGTFNFTNEQVGSSTTPNADEEVVLDSISPSGEYVVLVHGFTVPGNGTTFTLTIDATYGDDIGVTDPPTSIEAGKRTMIRVCPDAQAVAGRTEPSTGVLFMGPTASPQMMRVPVRWYPTGTVPTPVPVTPDGVFLPALLRTALFGVEEPPPAITGSAVLESVHERATR